MVAVLNSSLLAARSTGTPSFGTQLLPREADGNARVAADIAFASPARDRGFSVTTRTLFDTQLLAQENGSAAAAASPARPGLDPLAVIDAARFAARAAESRAGKAGAADAAALFEGAQDGIASIGTLLARMEQIAADSALTDLDTTDGYTPPSSLSGQDRARMNAEFAALRGQIDSLVEDTMIGGVSVLGGFSFEVAVGGGGQSGDSLTVGLSSARAADLASGLDTADVTTRANADAALTAVQDALDQLDTVAAQARGALNRLGYAAGELDDAAGVADAARAVRLTPRPALETGRNVAASLLAQRGITDPPAGLGIDLTLLQGFTGIDLPARQDETAPPSAVDTAGGGNAPSAPKPAFTPAAPAPRPAPKPAPAPAPAALTPDPAGTNLSVSV